MEILGHSEDILLDLLTVQLGQGFQQFHPDFDIGIGN
jgi:hypothetical protein